MTPDEIAEIRNDLDEVCEELFGDSVIFVDEDAVQTVLSCLAEDLEKSGGEEGLEIDAAGMRLGAAKKLTILKKELATKGVTLAVTGHFLINGERWDFEEDFPIRTDIVPLAGIQNMVECVIRKAVEVNHSLPGSEFTYRE